MSNFDFSDYKVGDKAWCINTQEWVKLKSKTIGGIYEWIIQPNYVMITDFKGFLHCMQIIYPYEVKADITPKYKIEDCIRELLPKEYAELAISRIDRNNYRFEQYLENKKDCLVIAFEWRKTKEGLEFWDLLNLLGLQRN